jgi:hypothetical protein
MTGTKAAFSVYPVSIENRSDEMTAHQLIRDEVKLYFSSINALSEKENADYLAHITLYDVNSSSAVKLSSGETATAHINVSLAVMIKDKDGKKIIEKNYRTYSNYDQTSSLSSTQSNREEALREAIRDALRDLRHELERK